MLTDADKAALDNLTFTDNCGVTRYWSLLDVNGNPIRDLNSDILENQTDRIIDDHPIKLEGAASAYETYHLVYWLEDICGNRSEADYIIEIKITPRPDFIMVNPGAP